MSAIDLRGPLPTGTTLLEASAGTGKTYTITALVTRYVAEGHARLGELLVVTFSRAATSELRSRVRQRLTRTRDALADPERARGSADPVVALLADGSAQEVAQRRQRLTEAVADYDAATIATIHQFCADALRGLGIAADLDAGTALSENLEDLVNEVCDDVYLRLFSGLPAAQVVALQGDFTHEKARAVAKAAALDDPQALLAPASAPAGTVAGFRVQFADEVRAETERRKRVLRVQGFDDLLIRTRDALADPAAGESARRRLRDRYRIVLVDEFQDTDPVQWEVFERAFHGHRTLLLIGDPKQAIYGFRGGDIRTYLRAHDAADAHADLDTNFRSDPRLLDGLQTLFRSAALGDPRIAVRPVLAGHTGTLLAPPPQTPVQLRALSRDGLPTVRGGGIKVPEARAAVTADVAAQVQDHLAAGHTVVPRDGGPSRELTCGDLAVLVRTTKQALMVGEALTTRGIPFVLSGLSSVFGTTAAEDWLLLLEALGNTHRGGLVRRLALTSWFGWSAAEIDARGTEGTDEVAEVLRGWHEVVTRRGVAALFAAASEEGGLLARLLGRPDGERLLTDLRHVAEALHAEAVRSRLGVSGLLGWLRARVDEARADQDQERARRLETDDAAVQVVTIHASKGLEFPVVFVPFGWDPFSGPNVERLPRTHDADDHRVRHVGGRTDGDYPSACQEEDHDCAGEELRLLYVAATRAISRLVLWWAPGSTTNKSPLQWLLFTADPAVDPGASVSVDADAVALARLTQQVAHAPAGVEVVPCTAADAVADAPSSGAVTAETGVLAAAAFTRSVDSRWQRTSYTRLTREVHGRPAAVLASDVQVTDDEADDDALEEITAEPSAARSADELLRATASPMADLPGGTAFGDLVHRVLEDVLGTSGEPLDRLREAARRQLAGRPGGLDPETLAVALAPVLATPLGPLAGGRPLQDIPARDVLPELGFELSLAGGDLPVADVQLGEVGTLLASWLPEGDRVAPYAAALASPELARQPLRGYLTGSLDAVLRVHSGGSPRYVVADHKTNRLADRTVPLTAWHYRPAALDAAMIAAHYPLQALLYEVALHRFLRWRQPDYAPEQHLGGVLYLFLRGMCGTALGAAPEGEEPGVWSWHPPAGLVVELSDLLAGGAR